MTRTAMITAILCGVALAGCRQDERAVVLTATRICDTFSGVAPSEMRPGVTYHVDVAAGTKHCVITPG